MKESKMFTYWHLEMRIRRCKVRRYPVPHGSSGRNRSITCLPLSLSHSLRHAQSQSGGSTHDKTGFADIRDLFSHLRESPELIIGTWTQKQMSPRETNAYPGSSVRSRDASDGFQQGYSGGPAASPTFGRRVQVHTMMA
jgi:hypothetical protein